MAEAKFYTYVHRRPDTGEVFYVGKGAGGRCRNKQYRSQYWHRVVKKYGIEIEILACFFEEADAFSHERELIAEFRAAGVRLVNMTDGGDGPSGAKRSPETLKKMSEWQSGKPKGPESAETREKKRISAIGRPMSPEAIAKTAAAHRGMKRGPETLARMSAALKGKPGRVLSQEEIERLRSINTGRTVSAESRAKMSAAKVGRKYGPQSEEHRAKLGAAIRDGWARRKAKLKTAAEN